MILMQTHLESQGRRIRRWTIAAAIVATLHVGGAAWALFSPPSDDQNEDIEGAMVVELAAVAMAPKEEQEDLAIGQRSEDSDASPPPVEEIRDKQPDETAQVEEAPQAVEPEVVLPAAKPEQKEEPEEQKPQEAQPAPASVASVAAAPPPIEAAVPSPAPAAPAKGNSQRPSPVQLSWQKTLVLHLNRHKRYPAEARSKLVRGTVMVDFTIDRSGIVTAMRIIKSSGSDVLDDEALAMLRRASPLPMPPAATAEESLSLIVPVKFDIR